MNGMGCVCAGITAVNAVVCETGDDAWDISCRSGPSGKLTFGLRSNGVIRVSGEDESEVFEECCNWGGHWIGVVSDPRSCWSTAEGVGDLVMGREKRAEEGEGMLATLPSLEPRFGLLEESYGFARFVFVLVSCFRLDGARPWKMLSVERLLPLRDHSESMLMNPVTSSACRDR